MVGEEGSEQVGGHERVEVGDKGSGFGDDRGLGGGLGGGLEGEGGPHLPPVTVEVEGGGGPLSVLVVQGVDEQGDGGLVHGEGLVVICGGHFTSAILAELLCYMTDSCLIDEVNRISSFS